MQKLKVWEYLWRTFALNKSVFLAMDSTFLGCKHNKSCQHKNHMPNKIFHLFLPCPAQALSQLENKPKCLPQNLRRYRRYIVLYKRLFDTRNGFRFGLHSGHSHPLCWSETDRSKNILWDLDYNSITHHDTTWRTSLTNLVSYSLPSYNLIVLEVCPRGWTLLVESPDKLACLTKTNIFTEDALIQDWAEQLKTILLNKPASKLGKLTTSFFSNCCGYEYAHVQVRPQRIPRVLNDMMSKLLGGQLVSTLIIILMGKHWHCQYPRRIHGLHINP